MRTKNNLSLMIKISVTSLVISGCAVSTDYDKSLGQQNAQVVEQQMGLYSDQELRSYVKQVGARLVNEIEDPIFDFQFEIVDDATPNAFALPGGYIYISRGLLSIMNNEDELACVLGHEIIHVTERHSVSQMKRGLLPGLAQVPGNLIGTVINEDLGAVINAPITVTSGLFMANYSRGHETQSDELGVALAAKAGYDPMAMGTVLTRMNNVIEYTTDSTTEKSYFDSHPYTPERVIHIDKVATPITYQAKAGIQSDYLEQIDGLPIGQNANNGAFQDNRFIQPQMSFSFDFPADWQMVNTPVVVGAMNKSQSSVISITLGPKDMKASDIAIGFSEYLKTQHKYDNDIQTTKLPWQETLYNVQIIDNSQGHAQYLDHYWVDINNATLQIMTLSTQQTQENIKSSAMSIKPLSDELRSSIKQAQLDIVEVQVGDDIQSIIERTRSTLDSKGIEALNGIEPQANLVPSSHIKVVVEKPL